MSFDRTCPFCGVIDNIVVEPAASVNSPDVVDYLTCGDCRAKLLVEKGKLVPYVRKD